MVAFVPPLAGPDFGDTEVTLGLPGGYTYRWLAGRAGLQPVTVQSWTLTSAGFCATVCVVTLVLPCTANVYCVPFELAVPTPLTSTGPTSWPANPRPLTLIGAPPVSGAP